jgi:Tfp pilus assembly protein PilO
MKFDITKILDSFNNLNDQMRYGIFGGVVFLILLLDVFFLVGLQMASISDINSQVQKLSDDTQQVLTDRGRISVLRKNLAASRTQFNALSAKIRPIQEVPAILSTISSIANDFGVKIDQLVPEKGQQESLTAAADGKYYALPIVIKAHCGYHMFGHFLNKLENEDMYFILKDFMIQNDGANPNIHSFSLTIKMILVDRGQAKNL